MNAIASVAAAGLTASSARFEASARRVAERPHADLPAELMNQKLAAVAFEANVAVLRTAIKMTKSMLDILV